MRIKSSITSVTFIFTLVLSSASLSSSNLTFRSPGDIPWPTCSGDSAGHRDSGLMERWLRMGWRRSCGSELGVRQRWPHQRFILGPDI
jgi:hypothetical protein